MSDIDENDSAADNDGYIKHHMNLDGAHCINNDDDNADVDDRANDDDDKN